MSLMLWVACGHILFVTEYGYKDLKGNAMLRKISYLAAS